jgi:pimeloyl-ACP methyl ester carboxylesterase
MPERVEVATAVGPVPVHVSGSGPAVLGVHGLLLDSRLWGPVGEVLGNSVRLVLPDLPLGAHRAPVPDRALLTPAGVARALVDVLDGLGLERAVLLGNDTGGALCQIAAAARPDRVSGLVLAGCDAFEHFPPPLLRPLVALAGVPGVMPAALRVFAAPRILADPGRANIFTTRGLGRGLVADLLAPARGDAEVGRDLVAFTRSVRPEPLLEATPGLRAHTGHAAVVWGRRDRVFPARDAVRLAELLGTEVRWAEDAATFVPWDRPDLVADAVRAVLAADARLVTRGGTAEGGPSGVTPGGGS